MQTLYAQKSHDNEENANDLKFLNESLESMIDLYLVILALLIELHKKAEEKSQRFQNKLLSSAGDKDPNFNLLNNKVLKKIRENAALKNTLAKRKLNVWDLDFEYVDIIYKDILSSDIYNNHNRAAEAKTFADDKQFLIEIYSSVIAPHDKLYDYFEDKKLTWIDDLPVVNTFFIKVLKKLKIESPESQLLPELYKDQGDKEFAKRLYELTKENQKTLTEEINTKTTNWDAERLANIDGVLLQMAVCELQKFPSIPVKVTINEYLEIAKEYSTPKSSIFINGILDKLLKEYKQDNKYPKTGRGLIQ
ncbi:MAG: transcription antitermination factor NusB [Winogradskyella sp.]|nr:transcription antitermination factor NusB [Winogradskyella sp.]